MPFCGGHPLAHGRQIVAYDAHDAGGIDEGRLGLMPVDQFVERGLEFFFAAEDHVLFLKIPWKKRAGAAPGPEDSAPRMSQV